MLLKQLQLWSIFVVLLFLVNHGLGKGFSGGRGGFSGGKSGGSWGGSRPVIASRPAPRPVVVVRPQPRPVVVVRPQPRPVVVVRPQPRPVVVVRPRPVVIIRPRPATHRVIIYPVYHPYPIYSVYIPVYHNHNSNQPKISEGACVKNKKSLFATCQAESERNYPLASLNTTWRTCCSTYSEMACYLEKAGKFCTESDAKALIDHSRQVADYFGSTVCKAIQYTTWDSSCKEETKEEQKFNSNLSLRPDFIALPPASGNEKTCIDKLRTKPQPEGDLTQKCLNASISIWDSDRRKLWSSQIYETCCAMYDALNCIERQANDICTSSEQKDLADYKKISFTAFSRGVCRAVPYEKAGMICRGETGETGQYRISGSYATLPTIGSLILTVIASLFMFSS